MKLNAIVAGVGMTPFGKHMDTGLKALGARAVEHAVADAGIELGGLEAAWVGNAAAGLVTGQECIRGQVILRSLGLGKLPVVNVENACASASTALNQAAAMVTAGLYDVVLALGVEKLYHADKKRKSFAAILGRRRCRGDGRRSSSGLQKQREGPERREERRVRRRREALDVHGHLRSGGPRPHEAGTAPRLEQFAAVSSAKNSFHGSLNPRAQFREALTVERRAGRPDDRRAADAADVLADW